MLKKIFFAALTTTFCFNILSVSYHLTAQETTKAVKATNTNQQLEKVELNVKDVAQNTDRTATRIESQIKRLTKDLELTEQQVVEIRKLYLDSEAQQVELRSKIAAINTDRQARLENLLTPEQKQKMVETKNNLSRLRTINKAKMDKLKSAAPNSIEAPQTKQAVPQQETK